MTGRKAPDSMRPASSSIMAWLWVGMREEHPLTAGQARDERAPGVLQPRPELGRDVDPARP